MMRPSISESEIDEPIDLTGESSSSSILRPSQRENLPSSESQETLDPSSQSVPYLKELQIRNSQEPLVAQRMRSSSRTNVKHLDKPDDSGEIVLKIDTADLEKMKVKKCQFPRLTSLPFLGEIAESFENSVNNYENRLRYLKKKHPRKESDDEKEWFYRPRGSHDIASASSNPHTSNLPLSVEYNLYFPTDKMMPDATPSEIARIDHYRDMFKWEKRHTNCAKRKVEYIMDFKRKNQHDLYKVKWCGIPEVGATWVRLIDMPLHRYNFSQKINDFWKAAKKVLPHKKMPVVRRSNYSIPPEYSAKIITDYVKEKHQIMKKILAQNPLGENLMIENEFDLYKTPFSFEFIKENKFIGNETQREEFRKELESQEEVANAMGHLCMEECGECTTELYNQYDLAPHKATWTKYRHYQHVQTEEGDNYWKVVHPHKFLIFECTDGCVCRKNGTCKNDQLSKLRANYKKTKFSVFRTGDDRGWGLKAMQRFKEGEAVIEYVGELMREETFRQAETKLWRKGLMYSMDLPVNDNNFHEYVIDSSRKGNHSRLINHSCDPNLTVYNIIKDDRNVNRPCPVLFALKDIEPGTELTFNYKVKVKQAKEEDDSSDGSSTEGDSEEVEWAGENGQPFVCQCGSKNCKDRQQKNMKKKKKQDSKKRKIQTSSKNKPSKKPKAEDN